MARITVEDCLKQVDNRFALIHLAAKRVRQLRKGAEPLVICKNKDTVTALREIAQGKIRPVQKPEDAQRLENLDQLLLEGIPQVPVAEDEFEGVIGSEPVWEASLEAAEETASRAKARTDAEAEEEIDVQPEETMDESETED